ncbi:MAG: hypothetical protein Q7W55_13240 [Pseudohongiella sp.]|nr:hypothetical protein [Pseudohongiella sp.]MDO9518841.1 hypothetical protein [Pseudohongiella sp.]
MRFLNDWRQGGRFAAFLRPVVLSGAGIICLLAIFLLSRQTSSAVELGHYYEHSCDIPSAYRATDNSGPGSRLRLLMVTPAMAADMAGLLCERESVQQLFTGVDVSWRPRTELTTGDLVNENYDVIWNREHFLTGLLPDLHNYYDILLHYDNYAVFWLSLQSTPVMTAEYFRGKRIGLLSDVSSHTHHLLPLRSLRTVNSHQNDIIPVYFDDTSTLYDSFYRGEIDLMTGGLAFPAGQPVHRTLLDNSATAATFFIRKDLQQHELRCDIIDALELLAPLWQGIKSHTQVNGDC